MKAANQAFDEKQKKREILSDRLRDCTVNPDKSSSMAGGRREGLARLLAFDPTHYGRTRNFTDSPVSFLSPYLRHGMISVVEVRDHLKSRFANDPGILAEFLRQLAWRDFFEKVLAWYGMGIEEDLEEAKDPSPRSRRLPLDVLAGETGLPCMDGMLHELYQNGYLHNHARLWFAAYLCHYRKVRWQEGAKLFRQHLYDGDIASNSASWQWVNGTFSAKPYFMNKSNIDTFSNGRWCGNCRVKCPFDSDYTTLQKKLFSGLEGPIDSFPAEAPPPQKNAPNVCKQDPEIYPTRNSDLIWVHDAALSWVDPAFKANPGAAVAFIFNEPMLLAEPWSKHRLSFVMDGIDDLFDHLPNPTKLVRVGDPVEQIALIARMFGSRTIHISEHPNPWVVQAIEKLKSDFHVVVYSRPVFVEYAEEPKRFSRYWEKVANQVIGHGFKTPKRIRK